MGLLYSEQPELLKGKSFLDSLNLPDLMHAHVSAWRCIQGHLEWTLRGDLNSALAFVIYAGFAVALPTLDVVALASAAVIREGNLKARLLKVSLVLKKISMLDVSIMGIIVVVVSLRGMREKGVVIDLGPGSFVLIAAEVCHYAMFRIVHGLPTEECIAADDKVAGTGGTPCEQSIDV